MRFAAALVHDVTEDADWDEARLVEVLGDGAERRMALVRFATEPSKDVQWRARNNTTVDMLVDAARDERALVTADMGHNLRSLLRALHKGAGSLDGTASWSARAVLARPCPGKGSCGLRPNVPTGRLEPSPRINSGSGTVARTTPKQLNGSVALQRTGRTVLRTTSATCMSRATVFSGTMRKR